MMPFNHVPACGSCRPGLVIIEPKCDALYGKPQNNYFEMNDEYLKLLIFHVA